MLIHAVIFDMDGLELDTEPLYRAAWQRAAAEIGFILTDAAYLQLVGRVRTDAEQLLLNQFGPQFSLEVFRATCRRFEAAMLNARPLAKKPGLEDLLALLDSRRVPKAIATSTERGIACRMLDAVGLLGRFDAIAGGDEVANGKPSPELFHLAASRLGVNRADCLVLEDSASGAMAAHSAGMRLFLVPDVEPISPKVQEVADGVFDSLAQVAEHVKHSGLPVGRIK